jgi:hypothetical protein
MKTNLFIILWKKEKIHWKRIAILFNHFNGWLYKLTFGLIVALLVTLFHYVFAFMHTLYEIFLFIFARDLFKANMQKMVLKV